MQRLTFLGVAAALALSLAAGRADAQDKPVTIRIASAFDQTTAAHVEADVERTPGQRQLLIERGSRIASFWVPHDSDNRCITVPEGLHGIVHGQYGPTGSDDPAR